MTIELTVVGLGYIGLPAAVLFAQSGMNVRGVDIDVDLVKSINSGVAKVIEPGLDEALRAVVSNGNFVAGTDVERSATYVIAVPTPLSDSHSPDLSYVQAAAQAIAPHLSSGDLVIIESTCPIGTTGQVEAWLRAARPDLQFPSDGRTGDQSICIAYCPERVLPGNLMHELVHNDRIIGGLTPCCAQRAVDVYKQIVEGDCRLTTARTAEFAKLAENAFRDVNIAFANELSVVAHEVDVNVWELIELANLHPRVQILQPGAGVGGHCIAVDPWFVVDASGHTQLIRTARHINDAKPDWVVDQVVQAAAGLDDAHVVCLGLTYKPNVDDCRESPAIEIVARLSSYSNLRVVAVEPNLSGLPESLSEKAVRFSSTVESVKAADIVVSLVAHDEVRAIAVADLEGKLVVDPVGAFRSGHGDEV